MDAAASNSSVVMSPEKSVFGIKPGQELVIANRKTVAVLSLYALPSHYFCGCLCLAISVAASVSLSLSLVQQSRVTCGIRVAFVVSLELFCCKQLLIRGAERLEGLWTHFKELELVHQHIDSARRTA